MHSKFEQNIINIYGDKGKQWLLDLPNIVNKIAKKWNLTDLKPVDNLSINYVASGLHHDNILSDGETWKVIDPHRVISFPINEVWAFVQDIDSNVPFIAEYFNFKLEDVQKCYFMHAVLSSIWAVEDNMDPLVWLNLATKIRAEL